MMRLIALVFKVGCFVGSLAFKPIIYVFALIYIESYWLKWATKLRYKPQVIHATASDIMLATDTKAKLLNKD